MKIDKGVPIPSRGGTGKWQRIAKDMEVADSVFFATEHKYGDYEHMALAKALKNMGRKARTRWVGGGFRVWRVE